jgi:CubicO group peptidase (beta-lactamase class C family)
MFSSGKSISAVITALMVDRGLLDYDEKVCTYWPEFGQNGKDEIKISDILRHEGGLAHIRQTMNIYDTLKDNLKDNAIGEMIEKCKPFYLKTNFNDDGTFSFRSYHALSRGWVLNEIIRRVDPEGRTIGEVLQQDVNIQGLHCGLNDRDMKNARSFKFISPFWFLYQLLLPEKFGKTIDYSVWDYVKGGIAHGILSVKEHNIVRHYQNLRNMMKPLFEKKRKEFYLFDPYIYGKDSFIRGENPSASCNGSARGMAKLASAMANRGITPEGKMLMGDNTWAKMHDGPKCARDGIIGII